MMRRFAALMLLIAAAVSGFIAGGAYQNLFAEHPDSARWVYWAIGTPFAVLAVVLLLFVFTFLHRSPTNH